MFLFLKFLLVQSNFWNIEDYQIDSQFLKIFCESVQFSKYESDEEYFLNIFSEGIYKIDSNFNYSSIGIWPNYICDPLFSQENYIEIYENTARFDFPEKTLSLGFQKGSFLSINSENIPILIKTSSNFLILELSVNCKVCKFFLLYKRKIYFLALVLKVKHFGVYFWSHCG